jgi:hypothetical protein
MSRRLHIRSHEVFGEWTAHNVESVVFNAPGLETDTSFQLESIPRAHHIANDGTFSSCHDRKLSYLHFDS